MTTIEPAALTQIEAYVRAAIDAISGHPLILAHGFDHVDRVRRWAPILARGEGVARHDMVEAAALLHDIGLTQLEGDADHAGRYNHAAVGAEMAADYLAQQQVFTPDEQDAIVDAIRHHSDITPIKPGLGGILREADTLDALGAVGLLRAFASKGTRPTYDPADIRGASWGLTADDFTHLRESGRFPATTMMDQVNLQIAMYDNLVSATARRLGRSLVAFMRAYVDQLVVEVQGTHK